MFDSPPSPHRIVTLKLPPEVLRRIESTPPTLRKKRKSHPRKDGIPRRAKLGRPRKSSLLERNELKQRMKREREKPSQPKRPASHRPVRTPDARAEERRLRHRARLTELQEEFIVAQHATAWNDIEPESGDETEIVHVQLSGNTMPVEVEVPKMPEGLTDGVQAQIVRGELLLQELGRRVGVAMTKRPPKTWETVSVDDGPQADVKTPRRDHRTHQPQGQQPLREGPQITPTIPPPNPNNPIYNRRRNKYAYLPFAQPLVGRIDENDPAYHYARAIRDSAFSGNLARKIDPETRLDINFEALNNLRQYNANHIDNHTIRRQAIIPEVNFSHTHHTHPQVQYVARNDDDNNNSSARHYFHATAANSTLQVASPQPPSLLNSPFQPPARFHFANAGFLETMRDSARLLFETRRGRLRYRAVVAEHCVCEVRWREESNGRFVEDCESVFGYRRIGTGQSCESGIEGVHWRTRGEWRDIFRTGGRGLEAEERKKLGLEGVEVIGEEEVAMLMADTGYESELDVERRVAEKMSRRVVESVVAGADGHGREGFVVREQQWE